MKRIAIGGFGLLLGVLAAPMAMASGEWNGVREMYGVRWQPSLDRAIQAASPTRGAAKPIVWFRVLGDLEGLT